MRPRDRRLIQRSMLLASLLVGLMLAAMVWTAVQEATRGPAPTPPGMGTSPGPPADGSLR